MGDGIAAPRPASRQRRVTHGCPSELSEREAEVLRCVAEGLSNREIGLRLFISQNTVANHIRTILRKTGCANRTEATTYAHRTGCHRTLLLALGLVRGAEPHRGRHRG